MVGMDLRVLPKKENVRTNGPVPINSSQGRHNHIDNRETKCKEKFVTNISYGAGTPFSQDEIKKRKSKVRGELSWLVHSYSKKGMDLRIHNRIAETEKTIFEDAEYFANNYSYKLLPITFENFDEEIIHTEHNYCNLAFYSESEADEDCSRTIDYSIIKGKNYKKRRAKLKHGNCENITVHQSQEEFCNSPKGNKNCKIDSVVLYANEISENGYFYPTEPLDLSATVVQVQKTDFCLKEHLKFVNTTATTTTTTTTTTIPAAADIATSIHNITNSNNNNNYNNTSVSSSNDNDDNNIIENKDVLGQFDSDKENVKVRPECIEVTISGPDEKENYHPCDLFLNDVARLVPKLIGKDCFQIEILDRTCKRYIDVQKHRLYYIISESTWLLFQTTNERIILTNDQRLGHPMEKTEQSEKPTFLIFDQFSLAKCLEDYCIKNGGCFEYTALEEINKGIVGDFSENLENRNLINGVVGKSSLKNEGKHQYSKQGEMVLKSENEKEGEIEMRVCQQIEQINLCNLKGNNKQNEQEIEGNADETLTVIRGEKLEQVSIELSEMEHIQKFIPNSKTNLLMKEQLKEQKRRTERATLLKSDRNCKIPLNRRRALVSKKDKKFTGNRKRKKAIVLSTRKKKERAKRRKAESVEMNATGKIRISENSEGHSKVKTQSGLVRKEKMKRIKKKEKLVAKRKPQKKTKKKNNTLRKNMNSVSNRKLSSYNNIVTFDNEIKKNQRESLLNRSQRKNENEENEFSETPKHYKKTSQQFIRKGNSISGNNTNLREKTSSQKISSKPRVETEPNNAKEVTNRTDTRIDKINLIPFVLIKNSPALKKHLHKVASLMSQKNKGKNGETGRTLVGGIEKVVKCTKNKEAISRSKTDIFTKGKRPEKCASEKLAGKKKVEKPMRTKNLGEIKNPENSKERKSENAKKSLGVIQKCESKTRETQKESKNVAHNINQSTPWVRTRSKSKCEGSPLTTRPSQNNDKSKAIYRQSERKRGSGASQPDDIPKKKRRKSLEILLASEKSVGRFSRDEIEGGEMEKRERKRKAVLKTGNISSSKGRKR